MIERCTSPNHPGWLQLRIALWPHHTAEALLREMAQLHEEPSRYAQFISSSPSGTPQGFVEVAVRSDYVNGTKSSPVAFLEGVYVAPSFRGQGVARALIATAEKWAVSVGCAEFASDALLANTASHAMHLALGFQETQRVVFFRKSLRAE